MRLSVFWSRLYEELKDGRSVFACLVVDQQKGSPGTTAARLLLTDDGRQFGTIGGGIMEKELLASASALLAAGSGLSPQLRTIAHRATPEEAASGLICGGSQTNLKIIFRPEEHLKLVKEIAEAAALEKHEAVCINASSMDKVGIAGPWTGESVSLTEDGAGNWQVTLYLRNQRRMAVFGGGHCGAALGRLMADLGYAVSVIDPRGEVLEAADLPSTVERINESFFAGAASVAHAEDTHAVVMTFSMVYDVEALAGVLENNYKSGGVMGSRPKIAKIRSGLFEKGFSRLQVESIRAPIGLSFNSDTPAEIAVSVAAEVLLDREKSKNGKT
jgi:xanthine dehydrogenase accessory factor